MAGDVTLKIDAETANAVRNLAKFAQEMKHVESGSNQVAKSGRRAETGIRGMVGALTVEAAVSKAVDVYKQLADELRRVGEESSRVTKALTPLAMIQSPGQSVAIQRAAAMQGARAGFGAEVSGASFAEMQSIIGTPSGAAAASQEIYDLMRLGASNEGARGAIAFGLSAGLTAQESSALILKGAMGSRLSVDQFASQFVGTSGFSDVRAGTAAQQILSQARVNPSELGTVTKSAGLALEAPSKLTDDVAKAMKAQGQDYGAMSAVDKLDAIANFVKDPSMAGLMRAGIGSEEKARGISELIPRRDAFRAAHADLLSTSPDFTDQTIARLADEDPAFRRTMQLDQAKAMAGFDSAFGTMAGTGQAFEAESLRRGRALRDMGLGVLTKNDGSTGIIGDTVYGAMFPASYGSGQQEKYSPEKDKTIRDEANATLQELLAETKRTNDLLQGSRTGSATRNATP